MSDQIIIASYGGGTNSTAGIIDQVLRGERIDLILFADPGGEKPGTYNYIKMFNSWLVGKGYPSITFVSHFETLEDECLRERKLPSKAYGFGSCSDKFKIRPQRRFIKSWAPAIESWKKKKNIKLQIFYDAGEEHRAENQKNERGIDKQFLLIERDINRDGCVEIIRQALGCQPGKRSCFFCPSNKKHEIRYLQENHPDLLERALEIERVGLESVAGSTILGLGRYFNWGEMLKQDDFFPEDFQDQFMEESCGCYDG